MMRARSQRREDRRNISLAPKGRSVSERKTRADTNLSSTTVLRKCSSKRLANKEDNKSISPPRGKLVENTQSNRQLSNKCWDSNRNRKTGCIRYKTNFRNTIYDLFQMKEWKEADDDDDWDILWYDRVFVRSLLDHQHLDPNQRVNHYRNHYELTRKDLLAKNLKRARKQLHRDNQHADTTCYDFFPTTFFLPAEYALFVEAFRANPGTVWIMKPIAACQGKGIFLFTKLNEIGEWRNDYLRKDSDVKAESYIVQQYLTSPYLIGVKKFDLRIYALVPSYSPLTIFLNRGGFARFTSSRFNMDAENISNTLIHLTNVAVQKTNEAYNAESGGKWFMHSLRLYFVSKFGVNKTNKLFWDMQQIVIRSNQAVEKIMINDKHCFQLYGYDILIDSDLKPWLIEVNASPSLSANSPEDYKQKVEMLDDVMHIVLNYDGILTGNEDQVGSFDLIYRGGDIKFDKNCTITTFLGCKNDREAQLKRLAAKAKDTANTK